MWKLINGTDITGLQMTDNRCQKFPDCAALSAGKTLPQCGRRDCPGRLTAEQQYELDRDEALDSIGWFGREHSR
jgi:hypothetical protein